VSVARPLFLAMMGICMITVSHPAVARPRDDVMSKAFRCAIIGDTRTWLDCYYGAAQPAREALGMSAAPAGQVKLIADPPHGAPATGEVEIRDEVLSQAFTCKNFSDDQQWLNCYYAAAQPARTHLGLPSAGQIPQPPQPASAKTLAPPASFGVRAAQQSEIPDTTDHISARMASYSFDPYGIFTVTLANGQMWKQISGDTSLAHWTKPATSYTARLSHGFLGSYNLAVAGASGVFKVKRVR
jgi:hypothetical protein